VSDRNLPDELLYFIAKYIVSVEKMEILLLLSDTPESTWNAETVFRKILSNQDSIQRWLKELAAEGFLKKSSEAPEYRYQPSSPALGNGVSLLKSMYRERPTRVIEAIFSQSTDQLRKFSDAFRIRKDT